jgi:RNA polymerase sigma factor (sigma-70 family)
MNDESLKTLFEKLDAGDVVAAHQLFSTYERYLRMVVRRRFPSRLRAKFDSLDIVQAAWTSVLERRRDFSGEFADPEHLRAFLVRVTQNRLIDHIRKHENSAKREQSLSEAQPEEPPSAQLPEPLEQALADDLWQRMLKICSPVHRKLLCLKRDGCSLEEIASQTGMHKSSVRRILYTLARLLEEHSATASTTVAKALPSR